MVGSARPGGEAAAGGDDARAIQRAARIGVQAALNSVEWGTMIELNRKHDYDLLNSANTFRPDPDGYIYPQFHSKGNINNGYSNPKLDPLIDQARTTTAYAQRKALYQEIQKTLLDDCPAYWWYDKFNVEAVSTRLRGYAQSFIGRRFFLKNAWLG
jgi:peptide/nickel transport system substrate-binding protein